MYHISENSWHFKLWRYMLDKNWIPMWFLKDSWHHDHHWRWRTDPGRGMPNDLCSYVNRLLLYFLFQCPAMMLGGIIAAYLCVFMPIMDTIMMMRFGFVFPYMEDDITIILGLIALAVETIGLLLFSNFIFKERGGYRYIGNKLSLSEDTKETVSKAYGKVSSPFKILGDYIMAIHNKVCLRLSYELPKQEVDRGYGHRDVYPAE